MRLDEDLLLREQYRSLTRLVPVLYTVVIVATATLSLAFTGTAPAWLVNWLPMVMLGIIAIRMRYWLRARALVDTQGKETMRRDILMMGVLGPGITFCFTLMGIALMAYADPFQQSLAIVSIWITAAVSAFCLAAVVNAAIMVTLAAGAPITFAFLASGNDLMFMLSWVFATITCLVVYMLRNYSNAFMALLASRQLADERRWQAEKARVAATEMAYTDYLTNMSNRRHFEHLLEERVRDPEAVNRPFAVGIIDLDGFKPINDVHGHGVGDAVLFEVAARLTAAMAGRGRAARIGGDEFAILADGVSSEEAALQLVDEIRATLAMPYEVSPKESVGLSCSVGVALYPASSTDAARLIDQADMALYKAKARERGSAEVFAPDQEDAALERARIEQALRRALADETLTVNFQPIMDLDSGRLSGFEALARWYDPQLGQVSPAVFIPIAEKAGLIEVLTDQLLYKAARTAATWPDGLVLSFNLSAEQLVKESAGLRVLSIIAKAGLSPHRFEAEVTETALMRDLESARRTIVCLKAAGVRVALDDFGTGYSSLSQIKDLPLDKVKIDKSFVDQIVSDPKMANLVRAIITMCANLELRCVAEGIERADQLDALKDGGCANGQGYLFSRPVPMEELRAIIDLHAGTKAKAA